MAGMKSKYGAKMGGTPMKTKYAAKGTMGMKTKYGAKAGGLVKKKAGKVVLSGMAARRNCKKTIMAIRRKTKRKTTKRKVVLNLLILLYMLE